MGNKAIFLAFCAALVLSLSGCNKSGSGGSGNLIDEIVGTYSYTDNRTVRWGGEDIPEANTGTFTVSKKDDTHVLFSGDAIHTEGILTLKTGKIATFSLQAETIVDDEKNILIEYAGAEYVNGALSIYYVISGEWKKNGKKASYRTGSTMHGTKR